MNFNNEETLEQIELSKIRVSPYQPRKEFNQEELEELAASITSVGFIHPPLVRPLPEGTGYEIISGERRFRAAQLAGLKKIPVYVRQTNNSIAAQAALIENIQRTDLNPLEIARSLKRLMIDQEMNQGMLSQTLGKKRSTIANYIRLLNLPTEIQNALEQNLISMGHAKAILAVENEEKQLILCEMVLKNQFNVRETEKAAASLNSKTKQSTVPKKSDVHIEALSKRLQEHLGTKVSIRSDGEGGVISIDYYTLDDLDHFLEIIGLKQDI